MKIRLSERARAARERALELMALHGLVGWSFAYNRKVRRLGECHFHLRTISLSVHHVEHHDLADVEDTILHEIAHALCGPSSVHHDAVWRETTVRLGADPDLVEGQPKTTVPGRWQAACPGCGYVYNRHRDPKKSKIHGRGKMWCCRFCGTLKGPLVWREVASPRGDAAGVAKDL